MNQRFRKSVCILIILVIVINDFLDVSQVAYAENDMKKDFVYEGNGYKVVYEITSQWNTAFNVNVEIINTSNKVIDNWALAFYMPYDITSIWNGVIISSEEGLYTIKNSKSNQDILIGKSVNFGFSAQGDGNIIPNSFHMVMNEASVNNDRYEVIYQITNQWNTAFNGQIIIRNKTNEEIEDWKLEFDTSYFIYNFWNAQIINHNGNHYIIKNMGYNANISGNSEICIGFTGVVTKSQSETKTINLYEVGINNISSDDDYDKDGLSNEEEFKFGTNPYLADTDEDGLEDKFEIYYTQTNPLVKDSDGNGINDGDEDLDGDHLTIIQELQQGTDNRNSDTDYDGITDYDEVFVYFTNPLLKDTDGDYIDDGDELKIGLDPLKIQTTDIPDNEICLEQKIEETSQELSDINTNDNPYLLSLIMNASGCVSGNLLAKESKYTDVMMNDAVVGVIPELEYDDHMIVKNVRINFQMKEDFLERYSGRIADEPSDLTGLQRYGIFKYFETEKMFLPIKTNYDLENNILYTEVDSLGTYCVIDLLQWYNLLTEDSSEFEEDNDINEISSYAVDNLCEAENDMLLTNTNLLNENMDSNQLFEDETIEKSVSSDDEAVEYSLMNSRSICYLFQNEYLNFSIALDGKYTIGTSQGNWNISTDDNKPLLFGHPYPNSSYTTLRIDGLNYMFYTQSYEFDFSSNTATCIADINGLNVKQEIKFVNNSNTGKKDIVQVKYYIHNTSEVQKTLGTRIMMDTMLGDNDDAPFRVLGQDVTKEREYSGEDVPQAWYAFNSLSTPEIIAQGTLYNLASDKPDKVQFANWDRVANEYPWDYVIDETKDIGDSAVCIIWNETAIDSGETKEYTTYYGISSMETDLSLPLALSVLGSEAIEKCGNEFSIANISAFIENISDMKIRNIRVKLELPEELEIINSGEGEKEAIVDFDVLDTNEHRNIGWQFKVKDDYYNNSSKDVNVIVHLYYYDQEGANYYAMIKKDLKIKNTPLKIVTSTGFKEIKLPENTMYGYHDYDTDGLTNYDEINFGLHLVHERVDGALELPTLRECMEANGTTYVKEGLEQILSQPYFCSEDHNILDTFILPILSDPTDSDTDHDGIFDGNETIEERLKYTTTVLDEKVLDDSKCFDTSAIIKEVILNTQDTIAVKAISQGEFEENKADEVMKNYYSIYRTIKSKGQSEFLIENINLASDYMVTVPSGMGIEVECEYYYSDCPAQKNKIMRPVLIDEDNRGNSQYHYIIDRGVFYYPFHTSIKFTVKNTSIDKHRTNISIEQDNWVYAPNGGCCNQITYYDMYNSMYVDEESQAVYFNHKLFNLLDKLNEWKVYHDSKVFQIVDIPDPLLKEPGDYRAHRIVDSIQLMMDDNDNIMLKEKYVNSISYITAGVGLITVCFPASSIAATVGGICTVIGSTTTGYSLLSKKVYDKPLITNLLYDNNCNIVYNTDRIGFQEYWKGWDTEDYINKYDVTHARRWNEIIPFRTTSYYDLIDKKECDMIPELHY